MKPRIYFFLSAWIFLFGTGSVFAQGNPRPMQRIESLKIAFISQRLNLSPQEAEKFWPIYNEYERDLMRLRRQRQPYQLNRREIASSSDSSVNQSLDQEMAFDQKMLDLRKEYRSRFERVLPPRKVALLYQAEKDFTQLLIRTLRARRAMKSPPRNRP